MIVEDSLATLDPRRSAIGRSKANRQWRVLLPADPGACEGRMGALWER